MDTTLILTGGLLLGCIIGLSWFAGSDAPFVPTKMDKIRKILEMAKLKKGRKFYELGSGDGRVVIEAARLGATSFGIEQSWIRVLYSKWKAYQLHLKNAHFLHGNIFQKSYQDADVVYIYLLPIGIKKLEDKFKNELKKDSIIITQTYHFQNWKPFEKLGDFRLYRV